MKDRKPASKRGVRDGFLQKHIAQHRISLRQAVQVSVKNADIAMFFRRDG